MTAIHTDYYEIENYYVNQKKYCLDFFKKAAKNGKKAVFAKYGQEKGTRILEKVKREYENLLNLGGTLNENKTFLIQCVYH